MTKRTKIRGLSVKWIKKIGVFRAKMAKNFSTFRKICHEMQKWGVFEWQRCVRVFRCQRSLLTIGGHWVKGGKNGGLSVKVSEKKYGLFGGTWRISQSWVPPRAKSHLSHLVHIHKVKIQPWSTFVHYLDMSVHCQRSLFCIHNHMNQLCSRSLRFHRNYLHLSHIH